MINIKKACTTVLVLVAAVIALTACNKELPQAVPIEIPANGATPTIATLLNDPSFSILKAAVTKAGLLGTLDDPTLRFTVFAPDDAAMTASGISLDAIGALPVQTVTAIVMYHVVPQVLSAASIPTEFPNLQYATILNPAPSVSPLLRLTTFPSKRGANAWVNNIPIIAADIVAVNGVVHKVARLVAPPSADLWSRINTDPNLTYLKAAISRADDGVAAGARLQDALNTGVNPAAIASNLTIFAPNDAAMSLFLTGALTQAFIAKGFPPANAQAAAVGLVTNFGSLLLSNPASIPDLPGFPPGIGAQLAAVITPTLAKGIVAYHIVSRQSAPFTPPGVRVFSVNIPTTPTSVNTLLNSAVAAHPGLTVQATFTPVGVSAITVKGAANATASNVLINPLRGGTSDQHYLNGVIHFIDQVLLPQ